MGLLLLWESYLKLGIFFLSFFFFNLGGVGMSTCPQRLKRGVSDTVELELQAWWMLRCGL